MTERPTLKTIATLSGLSVATVSRALGDAPDISARTKRRVHQIATEIGYVPHRAGVRLRTGRTHVISIVMSTENEVMNMTARLISSVALGLRDTSYHLNMTPYFPGDDPLRPIRYIVETRSADAVIFNQTEQDDPRVAYLLERKFPFATHGRSGRSDEHAYFDFDNAAFARLGIEKLASMGRRRILLLAPPLRQFYAREMVNAARQAAEQAGVQLLQIEGVSSDSGMDDIRQAVSARLQCDGAVDGLLTGSPTATMAAVTGFEGHGRLIGQDFDVVAKDAIEFLRLFRHPIIIVREDVAIAGEFLAQAAMHAIQHPEQAPKQHLDVPLSTL